MALRRDKYRCRLCGLHAPTIARMAKRLDPASRAHYLAHLREQGLVARPGIHLGLLEVDHIVPVCEGGGLAGLSNYRTLCQVCHADVSRALQARRRGIATPKKTKRAVKRARVAVKRPRGRRPR